MVVVSCGLHDEGSLVSLLASLPLAHGVWKFSMKAEKVEDTKADHESHCSRSKNKIKKLFPGLKEGTNHLLD